MDIERFIKAEAPNQDSEHDQNYAKELRRAYDQFKDLTVEPLKNELSHARWKYGKDGIPRHSTVADCMVLYELIKDHENPVEVERWNSKI